MKKLIKEIAMRCTQEQFDSIKDRLIEGGLEIYNVTSFDLNPYLTNVKKKGTVTNVKYNQIGIEVFKTFNADRFLKACGIQKPIEIDPVFVERYNLVDKAKELISEANKQGVMIEIVGNVLAFKILDNGK